jgi:predicted RNA-binding Zn-ribbon protein involved in translation (DUF1610 family)
VAIELTCPSCGKRLKVADSAAGKTGKCPQCGEPVKIPDMVVDAEEVAGDEFAMPGPQDAYGLESLPPGALDSSDASDASRRPCPACGEMIVKTAAKCRYCGEIFDETLKQQELKKVNPKDAELTTADWLFCILCSGIACIFGVVYMIQGKPKGIKMVGISLVATVIGVVIRAAIENANRK